MVDREELGVLGFVHSSGEARAGLGFEVEHGGGDIILMILFL